MTYWVDPVDVRYLKLWHRRGVPVDLIAEALGMSELRAWRILDDEACRKTPSGIVPTHRPWTPEEDAFLRQHYSQMGRAWCGRRIGRSVESVKWRAKKIGAGPVCKEARTRERKQKKVREYAAIRRRAVALRQGGLSPGPTTTDNGGTT